MQTFELTADQVSDLARAADPEAWDHVSYSDGVLTVPDDLVATLGLDDPATLAAAQKAGLLVALANKRWQVETAGVTVGGIAIATDDRSKQMIIGARLAADADADWTTPWAAADGEVVTIDAATMIAVSNAVLGHVSACFTVFASVKAEIEAGTVTTVAEIEAADWP